MPGGGKPGGGIPGIPGGAPIGGGGLPYAIGRPAIVGGITPGGAASPIPLPAGIPLPRPGCICRHSKRSSRHEYFVSHQACRKAHYALHSVVPICHLVVALLY